jgi:hypothetical protein
VARAVRAFAGVRLTLSQLALESRVVSHTHPGDLFSWRDSGEPRFAASPLSLICTFRPQCFTCELKSEPGTKYKII